MLTQTLTPAIYRTTISHCRQVPVHHSFAYRSYSWYVDVDNLPQLPWWLRPFARFHADDHFADPFSCPPHSSLRDRLDAFFAARGLAVPDGRITALLQARVLGYVFNPLSIFSSGATTATANCAMSLPRCTTPTADAMLTCYRRPTCPW